MRYFKVLTLLVCALVVTACQNQPEQPIAKAKPAPPQGMEQLVVQAEKNLDAQHALCYRYLRGVGGATKDYQKALVWCEKAAINNIPSSQTLLAEMHYLGLGIIKDHNKAFHWYKKAAGNGHTHAQYVLALMYLEQESDVAKNTDKAIIWLQRSASKGHKKAQQKLQELGSKQPAGIKQ